MTTSAMWIKLEPEGVVDTLQKEAVDRLNCGETEVVLDFASVLKIDCKTACAIEDLAGLADRRTVKVVLRAVNPEVYRVLKLLRLTQRFSFLT